MAQERRFAIAGIEGGIVTNGQEGSGGLFAAQLRDRAVAERAALRTFWASLKAKMPMLKPGFHRRDRGFNGHYSR